MAQARKLWIEGPAGRLEAMLRVAAAPRAAAVIAHPHPLHGGTLANPVVFHTDRRLHASGLTTLRFNFRGVGRSDGRHGEGREEVGDVGAAVAWLRGLAVDQPLLVVGYSFGAVCGIRHALRDPEVDAIVAIGLPLGTQPIPELAKLDRPLAVVQGDRDEFGGPEEIRAALEAAGIDARLYVVHDASHLFPAKAPQVADQAVEAANSVLGSVR